MKIQIHSKNSIERLASQPFSENTALISIGNYGSKPPVLAHKPHALLRLEFADIYPYEIDIDNYGKNLFRLFSLEQAKQIADFVHTQIKITNCLICQCEYGVSRSAAVAAAITEYYKHNGIEVFKNDNYYPNSYVFRTVLKELEKSDA